MEKKTYGTNALKQAIFALVTAILCILIQGYFGIIYTETDNFTTSLIVQGYFGDSNFCQTLSPIFCRLISFFCRFSEETDIFSLSIWVFVLIAFVWLVYSAESYTMRFLFFFFFLMLTARQRIFSTNYLITAGFLGAAGAYSLLLAGRQEGKERKAFCIFMGLLLFAMGFFLRNSAAMISLPFAGLGLCYEYIQSRNRERLCSVLIRAGLLFVVFLLLRTEKNVFFGKEPYLSSSAYSSARSTIEDWPMEEYEALTNTEGFTESEYNAAVRWLLMDTETLDTKKLQSIAKQGSLLSTQLSLKNAGQTLKSMGKMVKKEALVPFILCLLLFLRGLFSDLYTRIYAVCNVGGAFLILFYYTMRGRAPFRVWAAVLFTSSFTLLMARGKNYFLYAVIAVTCVFLADSLMKMEPHRFVTPFHAKGTGDETMFIDTLRDDIVCVWGGWSTSEDKEGNVRVNNFLGGWYGTICSHFIYQGRLPSKEFIRHNIPVGGWEYGQPYFNEHLENIGAKNPAEGLLDREDMFFVNGNDVPEYMDFMLDYMEEHFGPIDVIDAGEMDGNPVYKLRRAQ